MVDELCHGSFAGYAANGDNNHGTKMIRRCQSLPIATTETTFAEECSAVPHSKSEEQYVDRYGFITEQEENGPLVEEGTNEARRVLKWTAMLDNWEVLSVHRRKLIRRRLRKGLPDAATRTRVWPILLSLEPPQDANTYGNLWRNNNIQVHDIIERDIHRTFPKHAMFTSRSEDGQASLRRVLRAYSSYDTEIGYCQGMNFIAAMFLTILPEEQAFWMLVATMYEQPCCMRGLFAEGMRATHKVLYVADKLIHQFMPRTAKHLDSETIHVTMYATQWLLTVYTSSFPFELVTRVWDCFLFEGWKIVYRVMLALLQRGDLIKFKFEEILGRFRDLSRSDLTGIIEAACKIPLRTRHIQKYENEWTKLSNEQQVQQGSP